MSDEINLGDKKYVSSKRAAQESGYAQDYIGQLARSGQIDAQRVSGLWYVNVESLTSYKKEASTYAPELPSKGPTQEVDALVFFDGMEYVSAAKAADLTGYHPDYVSQLARSGAVLSRQVGNRWYVVRSGIIAHKNEKDALLAAVQVDSVGLYRPAPGEKIAPGKMKEETFTYTKDDRELIPDMPKWNVADGQVKVYRPLDLRPKTRAAQGNETEFEEPRTLTIRKPRPVQAGKYIAWRKAIASMSVKMIVISILGMVLLFSLIFVLYSRSNRSSNEASAASTSGIFERITGAIERIITKELTYFRGR